MKIKNEKMKVTLEPWLKKSFKIMCKERKIPMSKMMRSLMRAELLKWSMEKEWTEE